MPSISSPPILATKDPGGLVVVAANQAIQFTGSVTVTQNAPGQTLVDIGGVGSFANVNLNNLVSPVQPNEDLDFQTGPQTIINLPTPVNPGDVVNKAYVDALSPSNAWLKTGNTVAGGDKLGSLNNVNVNIVRANANFISLISSGVSFDQGTFLYAFSTDSLAFGTAPVTATGIGSFAFGDAVGSSILASGRASFAGGVTSFDVITSSGIASLVYGNSSISSADASQTFGIGQANTSNGSMVIGRYGSCSGTPTSWVATEPVFVIGNGVSTAARNNAFQIDKDGRKTTTAAEIHKAIRLVAGPAAISARTDRTIICDTAGAGGPLSLPLGVDGLEFIFSPKGVGGAVYTITPGGGNLLDPNVTAAIGAGVKQHIQFLGGVWYSI